MSFSKWQKYFKFGSAARSDRPRALITGISGQDGSYLAELLLEKNYEVVGTVRSLEPKKLWRLERVKSKVKLIETDLMHPASVQSLINQGFDEIYHLAGPSFIPFCWEKPLEISEAIIESAKNILEALRQYDERQTRFCNASSSEIYGNPRELPQTEETPLDPITPYGMAKKQTHLLVHEYREKHNLFVCNAILFNHESPRRDLNFAMHKFTDAAARVKLARFHEKIHVGNLHAKRDWGFAGDYVEAMRLMLAQKQPDDYVIATNKSFMVRDLLEITFATVGIGNWEDYVEVDPKFIRHQDIEHLCGDYSKAYRKLGWAPKQSFSGLISMMIAEDVKRIKKELALGSQLERET
jgi:GDPmannose 4,6-dehydratase